MPTRPCRFCLSLQGDRVFADFDVDDCGHVFLRRISFDCFGCCNIEEAIGKMNLHDSGALLRAVERDSVADPELSDLLLRYFRENQDVIWSDALIYHGLLD